MQAAGSVSDVLVAVPLTGNCRSPEFRNLYSFSDSKSFFSGITSKCCPPFCIPKLATGLDRFQTRGFKVRASENSSENLVPIAPLQLESAVGQLLEQILQTHPHLLPATIDQQLENLQKDREAEKQESPSSPQDLLLYRRIAEVKEKERQKILEEILYCFIVHKFVEKDILMIPRISPTSDPTGMVDFWPNQEQKLESVHSPEAFEMIQSHLTLVLGERLVGPLQTITEISKIKLGKLYAASIMYGYFLKRVDQRYQLERAMKTLPKDFGKREAKLEDPSPTDQIWDPDSLIRMFPEEDGDTYGGGDPTVSGDEKYRLKSYVMYLDGETLQRYATIRSKEAISLIEKQTQALFGRPDIRLGDDGSIETQGDEMLALTFSGLAMLVLEAVAFGSFLWDAEDYVESKYHFVNS